MQNIFTRVKVKIAEGVSSIAKRDFLEFNRVSRVSCEAKVFVVFSLFRDHKKLFIFHGNAEALTGGNQTSNFIIPFICHSGN